MLMVAHLGLPATSLITIPGFDKLTESERYEVYMKAKQAQAGTGLDAKSLAAALRQVTPRCLHTPPSPAARTSPSTSPNTSRSPPCRDATPPPEDEEEVLEESRRIQAEARLALEANGCPPCYPSRLDISTL